MSKKLNDKLEFIWCEMCGTTYIKCPRCGNNSCNGGSGRVDENGKALPWNTPDGIGMSCPICVKTWELEKKIDEYHLREMIENLIEDKPEFQGFPWDKKIFEKGKTNVRTKRNGKKSAKYSGNVSRKKRS